MLREKAERSWIVWHIEALSRQKKLQSFDRFAAIDKPRRARQTWQEQMAIMGRWAAVMRRVTAQKAK
jgi:hypothetical protein